MLNELREINAWRRKSPVLRSLVIVVGLYLAFGLAVDTWQEKIAPHVPDFCNCQCDRVPAYSQPEQAAPFAPPPQARVDQPTHQAPPPRQNTAPPVGAPQNVRTIQGSGDGAPAERLPGE